jgi:hypothetical protein
MTNRCLTLIASLALLTACQPPAPTPTTQPSHQAQPIADAYGFQGWDTVERIDFTYHEDAVGRQVQRRWTWEPKTDWVTLHGDARGGSVSYQTKVIGADAPSEIAQAHAWFVHDRRRLLLPFDMIWSNAQVTVEGSAPRPGGEGQATRMTVAFAQPDGSTQRGELFVDDATHRIVETLHPTPQGPVATRWEELMRAGPIVIAMHRAGLDGTKTWFADVRVKLVGDDRLHAADPLSPGE